MQTITELLAQELNCRQEYIANVIALLDEGNTIPFIARYRKEQHGAMDDTTLRTLETRLQYLRNLAQRREEVKASIAAQEKLTDELAKAIDEAATLAEVEDLYRPYKQKRRTRATVAREKGLEPLAEAIFAQTRGMAAPDVLAQDYLDAEKGVETVADALQGANDILAEQFSDDAEIRKSLRGLMQKRAAACSKASDPDADSVYRLYYEFSQPVAKLQSHQVLALNRGEREGALKVSLAVDRNEALQCIRRGVVRPGSPAMEFMKSVCDDSYDRLLAPSLERELRGTLTDGIVSAINRDVDVDGVTMTLIQTNAALNNGNSGGPLINQYGQVIGINVMKMGMDRWSTASVEGLGFAIPIASSAYIVNDILRCGEVQGEPVLGISVDRTPAYLPDGQQAARVYTVDLNGPGDKAGLEVDDLIYEADGVRVETSNDLLRVRHRHAAGEEMILKVCRGGEYLTVSVTLEAKK